MLHTEEYEIIVPESFHETDTFRLWERIGPMMTMLIPVVMMALFGSRLYSGGMHGIMYFGMISALSGALGGMIWGIAAFHQRKKETEKRQQKEKKDYDEYLAGVREHLEKCRKDNIEYMQDRYPSSAQIISYQKACKRYVRSDDYFFMRLGIGDIPFQMKLSLSDKRKELLPSENSAKAAQIIKEYGTLKNVPTGIELKEGECIGVLGNVYEKACMDTVLDMMLKIAAVYSEKEVKVCIFFDDESQYQRQLYEAIKFMPHLFTDSLGVRLAAGNTSDARQIIRHIGTRLVEKNGRSLIFVLNPLLLKGETQEDMILMPKKESGCCTILFSGKKEELSGKCGRIIALPPPGIRDLCILGNDEDICKMLPDVPATLKDCGYYMRRCFAMLEYTGGLGAEVPQSADFLELFDVFCIKDIDIGKMWQSNCPEDRLKVPIGIGAGGEKVYLDVHEGSCGPHGLIAGTTGSGKSELLQTYLISLCLCFSPTEVNFFLIDYKGGGTGNSLKDLPHCAGVISNLSGSQTGRAMCAIKHENEKRQILFSKYGVNHIDEYNRQRRMYNDRKPLPHLILIIDEFAELKKEEPDFMQQIISLSAVGRSLGIHLILATQKPSGVVDDKIWSNSKFKLCLKVQDRQDSMDMLKRPEAAYLKRPGQCYMQIGLDEYFRCFQTGYLGGNYEEGEKEKKVRLVKRSGKRIESADHKKDTGKTLLAAMTEYIIQNAEGMGYEKCRQLWIDELADVIHNDAKTIQALTGSLPPYGGSIPLGIYDDPSNQCRAPVLYDPFTWGHTAIAGCPASGRTTLLLNLILGLHNYEVILVDLSSGQLAKYSGSPNCIGFLFSGSAERIFFYHLKKIFKKRDRPLFVIIDNFSLFIKSISDENASFIGRMIAEGIGCNIFFVMAGNTVSDFPSGIFSKIKTTLCLEMTDKFGYADMMRNYRIAIIPKKGIPGRGLCRIKGKIYEFQAFAPGDENHDSAADLKTVDAKLEAAYRFAYVKEHPGIDDLLFDFARDKKEGILPIGYCAATGRIRGINISRPTTFLIAGEDDVEIMGLLINIKKSIEALYPELASKCIYISDTDGVKNDGNEDISMEELYVFAAVRRMAFGQNRAVEGRLKTLIDNGQGIYIGSNASGQSMFDFSDVPFREYRETTDETIGFMKVHGRKKTVKVIIPTERSREDEDDLD